VAIGLPEPPSIGNPVAPCEGQPRLLPGYLDSPTTSDQTITPVGGGKFGPIGGGLVGDARENLSSSPGTPRPGGKKKQAGGATIHYRLKGPAAVTFWVARISRRKHRSHLILAKGHFTLLSRRGKNSFKFSGWIGKHKLKPGSYVLIARPFLQGSVGIPHTMRFRIVRGG
jgi:hypothetical protein